jgi:DNA-binding transcriptional LysR family regulator
VECFLHVAEYSSINRASLELDMTQPELSRRIAALEHDSTEPLGLVWATSCS